MEQLKYKKVISDKIKTRIEGATEKEAKFILLGHLQENATLDTLLLYCDVAMEAHGYPKMNALGKKMKNALLQGGWLELCGYVSACGVCRQDEYVHVGR